MNAWHRLVITALFCANLITPAIAQQGPPPPTPTPGQDRPRPSPTPVMTRTPRPTPPPTNTPPPPPGPPQQQGLTNRISQNGQRDGANAASGKPSISSNGRIVVFDSVATNLVSDDTNALGDIFLRNQKTGEIRRVSVGKGLAQADGSSQEAAISPESPNGFVAIAYSSNATNLDHLPQIPDTNQTGDIYINLPELKFSTRASLATDGGEANGASKSPSITIIPQPDRVVVVYASDASNLVSQDSNQARDIFLTTMLRPGPKNFDPRRDLTTIRISSAAGGGDANGSSDNPRISGDGRFVAFESNATNLLAGQTTSGKQIFLYDTKKKTTRLLSKSSDGSAGDGDSSGPSINFPGSLVTFKTKASNIIEDGLSVNQNAPQFVLSDTLLGSNTRVNVNSDGEVGDGIDNDNLSAELDPSGRLVLFADTASNLADGDDNGLADIYVRDGVTASIYRISDGFSGAEPNGDSLFPTFGLKGFNSQFGIVVFLSSASNLIASDTEGNADVFISDYQVPLRPNQSGLRLELPPEIAVKNGSAKLTLEEFSGIDLTSSSTIGVKATTTTKYVITVRNASSKSIVSRLTSKKNTITISNLSSGTYTASYRTIITSGSKTLSTSSTSPTQRFTVD